MNAMDDWFAKHMPDTVQWAAQFDAEPVVARENVVPEGGFLVPPGLASDIIATKLSAYLLVPNELLDESREHRKPSRRAWLRYRIAGWREALARRAYKLIAGYDVPEGDDW